MACEPLWAGGDNQDDAFCLVAAAMANGLHGTVNGQDHDPVEPVFAGHQLPGAWRLVAGSICARASTGALRSRPLAVHSATVTAGLR